MKTRNGFVSNSSSSSFVVAIKKKAKGSIDSVKFIEFVAKHTDKNPVWKGITSIADKRKLLKQELVESKKDLEFSAKELNFWITAKDNKEFEATFGKLREHFRELKSPDATRNMRLRDEYETLNSIVRHKPMELLVNWIESVVLRHLVY